MRVKPGPPFLVTGAGRCGTHYLAQAMNELGVPTGHEAVFGYDERSAGEWGDWWGDCSWPGAAYPHRLPAGSAVLHLVRDPVAMVRSRISDNNLGAAAGRRTVTAFVTRHRPGMFDGAADDRGRAMVFVARWNRSVENLATSFPSLPLRRERIEELSSDPVRLARVVEFLAGVEVTVDECRVVQARLDDRTGSRGHRVPLDWRDIDAHPNGAEVRALASDYGYL